MDEPAMLAPNLGEFPGGFSMFLAMTLALLLAADGAQASPSAAGEPAAVSDDLAPGERRVKMKCKTEASNGSRVLKRRCMTLEEWKREEDAAEAAYKDIVGQRAIQPTCTQQGRSC